jgi:cytochrome P450
MPRFAPTGTEQFVEPVPPGPLIFAVAAANRDPSVFADPDRFDVDRDPKGTLTFGLGTHFCIGAHLARAELAVALDVFLERFDELVLTDPSVRVRGTVLRGPDRLPVRLAPA